MNNFLPRESLRELIDLLRNDGRTVIGPTVRDGAIVLAPIESPDQLPAGWTDEQSPATYRLRKNDDQRRFDFNVGPDSWKKFLFPPQATLAGARLDDDGWHFQSQIEETPRYAFLGVRACDLAAIAIQDRVFRDGEFVDPVYQKTREQVVLIAVNCSTTAATCFCGSQGTGPRCSEGFDLALTELDDGFIISAGSHSASSRARPTTGIPT